MLKHKALLINIILFRDMKRYRDSNRATQNLFSNKKLPRSPVISRVPLLLRIVRLVLIYVILVKKRELLFFSIIFKYKIYENLELVLGKNVFLVLQTSKPTMIYFSFA